MVRSFGPKGALKAFPRFGVAKVGQQPFLSLETVFLQLGGWRRAKDPDDGPHAAVTKRDGDGDDVLYDETLLQQRMMRLWTDLLAPLHQLLPLPHCQMIPKS